MFPTRIFLDLDDVLNDFTIYALRYVGCDVTYDTYDPAWGFDIVKAANALSPFVGFSQKTFWRDIARIVWASAPMAEGWQLMLDRCQKLVGRENVCVLTAPIKDPECAAGKMEWIYKFLPEWLHDQFLIGKPKHLCAFPDALLIDDSDQNVNRFRKKRGQAILVPRPWNTLHMLNPEKHLAKAFKALFKAKSNMFHFRGVPLVFDPEIE